MPSLQGPAATEDGILDAYRRTPGTTGQARPADHRLARALCARGLPAQLITDALLLASARRFARADPAFPPPTARSLAYFLPVIEELLVSPLDDSYRRSLTRSLQRALHRLGSAPSQAS